jgi:hypothetical protein
VYYSSNCKNDSKLLMQFHFLMPKYLKWMLLILCLKFRHVIETLAWWEIKYHIWIFIFALINFPFLREKIPEAFKREDRLFWIVVFRGFRPQNVTHHFLAYGKEHTVKQSCSPKLVRKQRRERRVPNIPFKATPPMTLLPSPRPLLLKIVPSQ